MRETKIVKILEDNAGFFVARYVLIEGLRAGAVWRKPVESDSLLIYQYSRQTFRCIYNPYTKRAWSLAIRL